MFGKNVMGCIWDVPKNAKVGKVPLLEKLQNCQMDGGNEYGVQWKMAFMKKCQSGKNAKNSKN
jgi:hypothetical protein